jgi:hypothetical protein
MASNTDYIHSPVETKMHEHTLLNLMKERIRYLSLLKEIYLKKQHFYIEPDEKERERLNELHEIFLKEMLQLEEKWHTLIKKLKSSNNLQAISTDAIMSVVLDEDMIAHYFAYKDKMYQLLNEIDRIKKNNLLMSKNAFPFIQKKSGLSKSNSRKRIAYAPKSTTIENPTHHNKYNKK